MQKKHKSTLWTFRVVTVFFRFFIFSNFPPKISSFYHFLSLFEACTHLFWVVISNHEISTFYRYGRCQGQELEDGQGFAVLSHFVCSNGQINGHIFLRNDAWFEFTVRYIQIRHFTLSGGLNRYKKFYIKTNSVYSTQVDRP